MLYFNFNASPEAPESILRRFITYEKYAVTYCASGVISPEKGRTSLTLPGTLSFTSMAPFPQATTLPSDTLTATTAASAKTESFPSSIIPRTSQRQMQASITSSPLRISRTDLSNTTNTMPACLK